MRDGFVKVAAASPALRVADCAYNAARIIETVQSAAAEGVKVVVVPELAVTGCTCEDLFLHKTLIDAAEAALEDIVKATAGLDLVAVVGVPVKVGERLYNAAAVVCGGVLLGAVPKSAAANYGEVYEGRWFADGAACGADTVILCGQEIPFGTDLLFTCDSMQGLTLGVEIGSDLFAAIPPSSLHTLAGATVIVNPAADTELVRKPAIRREMVASQSRRTACAYIFAGAGADESTNDVVYSGHSMVAQCGTITAENLPFAGGMCVADIDVQRIAHERTRTASARGGDLSGDYLNIPFSLEVEETKLTSPIDRHPFIPVNPAEQEGRCEEILSIQCAALKKRVECAWAKSVVIGISGGLDSTLALLATHRTFKKMGRPVTDIIAVSMPALGTTNRTKTNAQLLCEALGVTFREINITASVKQHLADIGHDGVTPDTTYENAQARERTQVLMDISNAAEGIVVGTGDLSEGALGWCTYNGDHMSMYALNTSIPKTLVRYLVDYFARCDETIAPILRDVLDTPVSPELTPAKDGEIAQKTEDLVGPYELHDFFLYHIIRRGCGPRKVFRLACAAFDGIYDSAVIHHWLTRFYKRFFSQQFKRTCTPNGPKVGSVALSPRGDWRMPSDASAAAWLAELEAVKPEK